METYIQNRSLRKTLTLFHQKYGLKSFPDMQKHAKARGSLGFSPSGLAAWLRNPILRGHSVDGQGVIHYETHPHQRLMSEEEYQQVEATLRWNAQHRGWQPPTTDGVHPLSGLIFCAQCHSPSRILTIRNRNGQNRYSYQCKAYRRHACTQKRATREADLEAALMTVLLKRTGTIGAIAELPPEHLDPPELQALKAELASYRNAPGDRAAGIIADIKQQIAEFYSQRAEQEERQTVQQELLLTTFQDLAYWRTLSSEEKREIYRALVSRVLIRAGKVEAVELKV